jgi:hypothetical protein
MKVYIAFRGQDKKGSRGILESLWSLSYRDLLETPLHRVSPRRLGVRLLILMSYARMTIC